MRTRLNDLVVNDLDRLSNAIPILAERVFRHRLLVLWGELIGYRDLYLRHRAPAAAACLTAAIKSVR